ncbi:putative membrane-anchored protein [Arthrobacter oryzae]|uniref:Putative membrane-anchored protein n=1 Tax=Arthrobacter oryzae TaxID=409290 RepID=A0A495EAT4_9MICC|nr:putative membrane-anchored protein [Arthrobacter oryzae]
MEPGAQARRLAPARRAGAKVPEITAWFWAAKVLTTGMGETTSDFMVHHMDPAVALGLGGCGLAASLVLQFGIRRYVPWVYWLAVVMVSVFGTMAADAVHVVLGVPYLLSAVFFLIALSVVFLLWYRSERTLSIHSVDTRRRETFYWTVVLATFALGTATGDLTAYSLDLGYLASGVVFAAVIAGAGLWYWRGGLAAIPSFWFVYILTRPLGASFADWTAASSERGGLGWGTGPVSLGLAAGMAALVTYLSIAGKRNAPRHFS